MNKEEATIQLASIAKISRSDAEDLYDSFFEKPVVPQYVADWYEESKDDFEIQLFRSFFEVIKEWGNEGMDAFSVWLNDYTNKPFQTLVNMHQFGYEVEKETKYRVKIKGVMERNGYLNRNIEESKRFLFSTAKENEKYKTKFTRKELEDAGFDWVFDCSGIEIEEIHE